MAGNREESNASVPKRDSEEISEAGTQSSKVSTAGGNNLTKQCTPTKQPDDV